MVCGGDVLGTGAGALLAGAGALGADAAPADPAAAPLRWLWWCRCRRACRVLAAPEPLAAGAAGLLAAGEGRGVLAGRVLAVAWVAPGRMKATAPAVATPPAPTVAVTARSRPWLRWR